MDVLTCVIEAFEKKAGMSVLAGAYSGSNGMGLESVSSDKDLFFLCETDGAGKKEGVSDEQPVIDHHFFSEEIGVNFCCWTESAQALAEWNAQRHPYPTYSFKPTHKPTQNKDGKPQSATEHDDFLRTFLIPMANSINLFRWEWNGAEKERYVKDALRRIDVLDYYYTRARGNWEHALQNEEVPLRKYLTVMFGLYAAEHIVKTNTSVPPGEGFWGLLSRYEQSAHRTLLEELFVRNKTGNKKTMVPGNAALNAYIGERLEALAAAITDLARRGDTTPIEVIRP